MRKDTMYYSKLSLLISSYVIFNDSVLNQTQFDEATEQWISGLFNFLAFS